MDYIHHYTSIANLALILSSKKLRFTRFDLLDDTQENGVFPDENSWMKTCCFISSWTDDAEENIPLWKMYASLTDGVRISMPVDMFNHHKISMPIGPKLVTPPIENSPLTFDELYRTKGYHCYNIFSDEVHDFYKKVIYKPLSEIQAEYARAITSNGSNSFSTFWDCGKYKDIKWSFQNEVRFVLIVKGKPTPLEALLSHVEEEKRLIPIRDEIKCDIEYIDVALNEDALKHMQITLAPHCSLANEIIVKCLTNNYIGSEVEIHQSSLKKILRK